MLLKIRSVSDKYCRENPNTHFMFNKFSSENLAIFEIIPKNMLQPDRSQKTIRRMRCLPFYLTNFTPITDDCSFTHKMFNYTSVQDFQNALQIERVQKYPGPKCQTHVPSIGRRDITCCELDSIKHNHCQPVVILNVRIELNSCCTSGRYPAVRTIITLHVDR